MTTNNQVSIRSPDSTGYDLSLEPLGDLVVDGYGDLLLNSGDDSIRASLLRRLQTPFSGYRRWVRTVEGLKLIDPDYYSDVFLYLSSSLTDRNMTLIREAISKAVSRDNRINVSSLDVYKTGDNEVEVRLNYVIKGETELRQLFTDLKVKNGIQT
jgi:phage baseplate assembly protein W